MYPQILIDEDLRRWLVEDIPLWDITTSLLPNYKAKGKIYAKQEGIIAGLFLVKRAFEMVGAEIKLLVEEGSKVANKTPIVSFTGDINSLLQIERLSLNILGRLSGIATQTDLMINITKKYNPNIRICATRKTVPGLSKYDKYAVTIGGGDTHRFNLSDMILLKENHLRMFNTISEAVTKAKETISFSKKVEVEVQNEEQAIEATKAGADIVMLDNFSPQQAKHVISKIKAINDSILIELSGNISLDNLEIYSFEGIDLISSGALTHSVKNFDLTMLIE
ncbi:MAG: carboxylating nicotinate-nucleotide diphosphorylase [Candidatus Heimdallarchaeota archaeon]|nr:carboxylating nicotinate-nucleotide diphosphorylase [Candidatus Heimdallarchaeota archaeon]MCK4876987.1 carboxylating nicotinate-nucleotide diphosphorylase [Candidatus Heimdallarchaeota archaeon]